MMMSAQTAQRPATRRGGRTDARAPALRRCIATGESCPKAELIRFVAGPDGLVVPDLAERLPGRGLWVSARRDALSRACARNLFAKAAKAPLRVPDDLIERVERLLLDRSLDLVGLAKRSGAAVSGFEKTAAWLASGRAAMLLAAVDAAEEGRRKLHALAAAQDPGVPVVQLFTAEDLGRALGHEARVHVAIAPGGCAASLARETARLAALRGGGQQIHGGAPQRLSPEVR